MMIVYEARKLAGEAKDADIKKELLQSSYDTEALVEHLAKICQDSASKTNLNAINVGKEAKVKLNNLGKEITRALVQRVADEFIDINQPIKKLVEVATAPQVLKNKQGPKSHL